MIGFLLKKTFFDLWDNIFRIVLLNLGFILSAAGPILLLSMLTFILPLSLGIMCIGILWCAVYLAGAALCLTRISDYRSFGFGDFFHNLRKALPAGLVLGGVVCMMVLLITIVIPFYLRLNSTLGLFLSAIIFWTLVIGILSLQFFPAAMARFDTKIIPVIKKCFLFFFDNPLFCIFSFIHNGIILVVSLFLAFLFPGPAGILLFLDEALRLRLLKYNWLRDIPAGIRKRIPWDTLLIDERERTGTRSLKNFIFPWKD
jgi:hypothetical protein